MAYVGLQYNAALFGEKIMQILASIRCTATGFINTLGRRVRNACIRNTRTGTGKRSRSVRAPVFLLCLAAFCSQSALAQGSAADPWQFINRPVYAFNKGVDSWVIRPVTVAYDEHVPRVAKLGVRNFFNNLDDVNVVVNDLLQLKMRRALNDSGRLVLNTTIGIGGLFDVAARMGMYKNYEDFGQTLGYWGVGDGGYLVLPLLGASTLRDTIGYFPDVLFNPIFWVTDSKIQTALYLSDTIDTRQSYLAAETLIKGDEYQFVRDAWLQRRAYLVADGAVQDDFDDF